MTNTSCIIFPDEGKIRNERASIGGKASSLAIAHQHGFSVPRYFVILPPTERRLSGDELVLNNAEQAEIQALLEKHFSEVAYFAVRSSAIAEDGSQHSFAGMLESNLFVAPHQIAQKVMEVRQSALSPRLMKYCAEKGIQPDEMIPAVIVQEMIGAEKSGVAFGADPVSGSRNLYLVSATWGLGSGLVSGECESDSYYITAERQIVQTEIACKTRYHTWQKNGMGEVAVVAATVQEENQKQAVLSEEEVMSVAELVQEANSVFSSPQDIEWCIRHGEIYLLQSRPITNLPPAPSPQTDCWHAWNNNIICEDCPGISTPLTYSLVQHILKNYLRDVTRCTSFANIAPYQHLFPYMTGYLRGAIYVDSKVLDTISSGVGCRIKFVQEIKAFLKHPLYNPHTRLSFCGALKSILQTGCCGLFGVVPRFFSYTQLPLWTKQLEQRVDTLLEPNIHHDPWRKTQAVLAIFDNHWYAMPVNSMFSLQIFGILKRLNPEMTVISNSLGSHEKRLSHQFIHHLETLSKMVEKTPHLAQSCIHDPLETIQMHLHDNPEIKRALETFLSEFGDRCEEDAKLESIPWSDNPLPLLRTIGVMAQTDSSTKVEHKHTGSPAVQPLPTNVFKKFLYHWLVREYQKCQIYRERLRLQYTRLTGILRRSIMEIGEMLYVKQVLPAPRDILFLSFDEIASLLTDTAIQVQMQETIKKRKAEYDYYLTLPPLPDEFKAWGTFLPNVPKEDSTESIMEKDTLIGQACSPGQISGEVVWYSSQTDCAAYTGKILAARYGDPSLVHVYPLIQGLLLERGSPLSHPAIVARELNLPTIVGLSGLSYWVKNGESVLMDGATGKLQKAPHPI